MSSNPFSDPNPYRSPAAFAPPQPVLLPGQKPAVWIWYVIYCVCMALLYLLCGALGAAFLLLPAAAFEGEDMDVIRIQGVMLVAVGGILFLLFAAAPFLPRSKFAWIYGFITIGIGLTSCCTMPASIPLIIFWLKPETKAYLNSL